MGAADWVISLEPAGATHLPPPHSATPLDRLTSARVDLINEHGSGATAPRGWVTLIHAAATAGASDHAVAAAGGLSLASVRRLLAQPRSRPSA